MRVQPFLMKVFLIALMTPFSLPAAVNANIDPGITEICMSVDNYEGCLESYTETLALPKCNSYLKTKCTVEIKFANSLYIGEKSNGHAHGFGTMFWDKGDKYIGQFINGERTGNGIYFYPSGNTYVGDFNNGHREGYGTFSWPNGAKYVGQFKNSKRHGQGTYFYAEGGSCVGEFREGKMTKVGSCKLDDFW